MIGHQLGGGIVVIAAVIPGPVLGLAGMGERGAGNPDQAAGMGKVLRQMFVTADEIRQVPAVEIDQVSALELGGHVGMVLGRALRIEFPAQKGGEILPPGEEVRPFPQDMVVGADLEVPGIAHEGELEQGLEQLPGQHFLGGDELSVARELGADPVAGEGAETAAQELREPVGIAPLVPPQGVTDAGATGLGDVHEQELVLEGQQHGSAGTG